MQTRVASTGVATGGWQVGRRYAPPGAEAVDADLSAEGGLVEPRLLNGAQTLTSLDRFLRDNERNPTLRKNEGRLRSIVVLCKVVHSGSRNFVTDVTQHATVSYPGYRRSARAHPTR